MHTRKITQPRDRKRVQSRRDGRTSRIREKKNLRPERPDALSSPGHPACGRSWHGICVPDGESQGIFLPDGAVSSGRSRVRANGIRTTRVTASRSLTVKARHLNAAGSRHSDSIQLYSLSVCIYLMYIYICYYHTSRTQRKHPVSHPSPRSTHRRDQPIDQPIAAIIALCQKQSKVGK
jgi:hypothetical protein